MGVPFVNAWFPPQRRGLAIGIFGMGMGGTAISALTTVKLVAARGTATPFVVTAIVLAVYAVVAALVLRDSPDRTVPTEPLHRRLGATLRLRITWQASALYAVAFGGYVAISVYLPVGEASGRYAPVAVENFQALAARQRSDTFIDPADPDRVRVNLLNWDGKGRPNGLFPPHPGAEPRDGSEP